MSVTLNQKVRTLTTKVNLGPEVVKVEVNPKLTKVAIPKLPIAMRGIEKYKVKKVSPRVTIRSLSPQMSTLRSSRVVTPSPVLT